MHLPHLFTLLTLPLLALTLPQATTTTSVFSTANLPPLNTINNTQYPNLNTTLQARRKPTCLGRPSPYLQTQICKLVLEDLAASRYAEDEVFWERKDATNWGRKGCNINLNLTQRGERALKRLGEADFGSLFDQLEIVVAAGEIVELCNPAGVHPIGRGGMMKVGVEGWFGVTVMPRRSNDTPDGVVVEDTQWVNVDQGNSTSESSGGEVDDRPAPA